MTKYLLDKKINVLLVIPAKAGIHIILVSKYNLGTRVDRFNLATIVCNFLVSPERGEIINTGRSPVNIL